MKRTLVKIMALTLALVTIFAFTACKKEIKNGSQIQRMKVELSYQDAAGEEVITTTVGLELYLNFAPETVAHFIALCEEGYYNNVCVSNVSDKWLEFGGYKYDADGNFVENAYTKQPINGEFAKNGWIGNKLSVTQGSLILKRDYDDGESSKYNTAKGTVIVCLSSGAASTFSSDRYCVFGMVTSDDANAEAATDVEKKSSIAKLSSLASFAQQEVNGNKVTTWFYEGNNEQYKNQFITKWIDEDGETHYAKGASIDGEEMTSEQVEEFLDLYGEETKSFLVVPYTQIVIKSITKA
ncbi:MAG: peptidylprolyl isomerase [Clostridia bacterium]|nr:peptidylprolyl isomerase [Clostridia bacterium]